MPCLLRMATLLVTLQFLLSMCLLPPVFGYDSRGGAISSPQTMAASGKSFFVDKRIELLWNTYIPTYMEDFFSDSYMKENLGVEGHCEFDVRFWMGQISTFKTNPEDAPTWALHMIDSWGKAPEGILSGHVNSLGAFDECVGIRGDYPEHHFQGLYCSVYILSNSNHSYNNYGDTHHDYANSVRGAVSIGTIDEIMRGKSSSIASCFPSSCSKDEVQSVLSHYFEWKNITTDYEQIPSVGSCVTNQTPELTTGVIVMLALLSILATLCVLATAVEIWLASRKKKKTTGEISTFCKPLQTLMAFSITRNTKALLSSSPAQETITCFYGLRFLSMAWIVLMHTNSMFTFSVTWNLVDIEWMYKQNWSTMVIKNGQVAVDTFFTMSGLLVTFNLLKALDRTRGKFNFPMYFLHRYLRLTPVYAFIVGCLATILPYLSSGPNWNVIQLWSKNCQRNWWHNLLYINNLIDYGPDFAVNGMCHGLTWYLSADMQLFVIAPLFIYPLWRWRRVGITLLLAATLASILAPGIIAYENQLSPLLITARADYNKTTKLLYFAPWCRAGPYLVGIWTGYFLYETGGGSSHVRLPRRVVIACWLVSTGTAVAVLFGVIPYFDPNFSIPEVEGALYAGLHRFVWGLVVAWVIVACVKGYASWVNAFLSWSVFGPLSKLTFTMYLLSYFVQMIFHLRLRQPLYYDTYTVINLFFAHLVMSTFMSYIFAVSIEVPFLRLDKLYLGQTPVSPSLAASSNAPSNARPTATTHQPTPEPPPTKV